MYPIDVMRVNEGRFSSGNVIIHFWDKTYQEINFKSTLNTLQIRKDTVRFGHIPLDNTSLYLFVVTFTMKLKATSFEIR